MEYII